MFKSSKLHLQKKTSILITTDEPNMAVNQDGLMHNDFPRNPLDQLAGRTLTKMSKQAKNIP